jgi:hypothetical protein
MEESNKIGHTKKEINKKAILEALEKSLGVVTTAVKLVGISRSTFYKWIQEDQDFAKKVKDIENITLDFVESQLHKQIRDGNTPSTIFYLKTKGKKRGYYEKQQLDMTTDDEPIKININLNGGNNS